MDEAGFKIVNNINKGDKITVSVEGDVYSCRIVDTNKGFESHEKEILLETESSNSIVIFATQLSAESENHYVCDAYRLDDTSKSIEWMGLITDILTC